MTSASVQQNRHNRLMSAGSERTSVSYDRQSDFKYATPRPAGQLYAKPHDQLTIDCSPLPTRTKRVMSWHGDHEPDNPRGSSDRSLLTSCDCWCPLFVCATTTLSKPSAAEHRLQNTLFPFLIRRARRARTGAVDLSRTAVWLRKRVKFFLRNVFVYAPKALFSVPVIELRLINLPAD